MDSEKLLYTTLPDAQGYYEVNADGIYGHTCKNRKAASADKKIVTVKYSPAHQCFLLTPKKTGTAKVTFSAVRKGKKVTCQGTVKVVKFQNPVKSHQNDECRSAYKNKETYSLQEGNLLIRMILKNTKRGEQVHIALSVER